MAANDPTKGRKIGLIEVRALAPNTEIFDAGAGAVSAFGARRRGGSSVSYFVMFRTDEGRLRRFTIGRHGAPWTPETARKEARRLLGEVVKGIDPAEDKKAKREAPTVNDLLDDYWTVAAAGTLMTRRREPKKASTLLSDKGRIDKHIRPILGAMKVTSVTTRDVELLMRDIIAGKTAAKKPTGNKRGMSNVRGGRGVATRTIGLLGAIFAYAIKERMRPDNPVRGIVRPADGRKERRLSDDEYEAIGTVLRTAEDTVWPAAVAATRFLLLTGWRSGEALTLRWADVDLPKVYRDVTRHQDRQEHKAAVHCRLRCTAETIASRRFCVPSNPWRRRHGRLPEHVSAHSRVGDIAGGHHPPCASALLRVRRQRSEIQ